MTSEYTPNRYKLLGKIGEGVHGVVLRAIDLTTDTDVAIKKIPLRTKYGEIALTAIREIKTLQNCDHKNVRFFLHQRRHIISILYLSRRSFLC